jgi:phosphoribosylglycinamide formyltransferase 1
MAVARICLSLQNCCCKLNCQKVRIMSWQVDLFMQLRLGILSSNEGSTLQAVIDACRTGQLSAAIAVVLSNNSGSRTLVRAREAQIPAYHISRKTHPDDTTRDAAILHLLQQHQVNLVVLSGYLQKLGPKTLTYYAGRVINLHPALLPAYGGPGMYGAHVHAAVLKAGEKTTGVTIHLADAEYDRGPLIAQRAVPVLPDDNIDSLGARVMTCGYKLLVDVLQQISNADSHSMQQAIIATREYYMNQ